MAQVTLNTAEEFVAAFQNEFPGTKISIREGKPFIGDNAYIGEHDLPVLDYYTECQTVYPKYIYYTVNAWIDTTNWHFEFNNPGEGYFYQD